ncbi:hypothetical protein LR48_Vigan09g056800 [Vigna angularis]|uniref:Putative plant transposon protein domain-containing protein n=1 Tax=Phaseolus angularis TaxID=3914 RepID=A0A0L9VB81_PHAAN|nr:hypothetical protein LR48_Vigan09g056800 [Vigna angularis]
MASSSGKRIKTIGSNKRKDKEPKRSYANKFLSRKHERHFKVAQDRRLLIERKARLIPDFAPQFGKQLENRNWGRLAAYLAPTNIAVVKEFYTNARRLGDHPAEEYLSYVRGHAIRYDPDSINRFLNTEWAGEQCKFALNMKEGADFGDVETAVLPLSGNCGSSKCRSAVNGAERWTIDEFHNVVAWPEEQDKGNRARAAEASAMNDEDDEDAFEDAEDDEEEEDSYDRRVDEELR